MHQFIHNYHLCLHLTFHEHITINNTIQQYITSYTVHKIFLHGNPNGRKPQNAFLYISKDYIHRKHQLPNSPAPTGRRLQPPIYRLQPEGSYNSLNSPATTRRRLQPPRFSILQPEGGYDPLSLPHPASLKYKCRLNLSLPLILIIKLSLYLVTVTIIVICHYHCHYHLSLSLSSVTVMSLSLILDTSSSSTRSTHIDHTSKCMPNIKYPKYIPYAKRCTSTIYHITHDMSQSCHKPCTTRYAKRKYHNLNDVPQSSTKICASYICQYHKDVPLTMNHNNHKPSTKDMSQACINITKT
jgi:hypothetical protein